MAIVPVLGLYPAVDCYMYTNVTHMYVNANI